jgi:hypothetical protein
MDNERTLPQEESTCGNAKPAAPSAHSLQVVFKKALRFMY